ncbi:cob(I)yrinic acid a,c-diamide adenosyltransferase [Crassaminicella indica]|uniref:Cob(I)yrinic acid a,c-diamide adenosyltransferase n=1 Tax=Crassaminicella indica TaxID=2855394 RepID=A0ABX8RFG3_9CLOT|nr:cob(I)yrinic acid a,c-diamide adenosyltransferase [Crassaminicella indica]QXM07202.1 cob(I)yrinic acid a,c-diamide adenosyltransferase [Crassaminicella indica]
MNKGYIHVYTGNGKGKTTAALGLTIRALGAGKKVFVAQFVKSMEYNELKILKKLENVDVALYGHGCFITKEPAKEDILAAQEGLKKVKDILKSKKYDVVILDEITIAVFFKLLSTQDVLSLLEYKPDPTELVITGRYCPEEIIKKADLVTEMREIKHYYTQGVLSREGIDK